MQILPFWCQRILDGNRNGWECHALKNPMLFKVAQNICEGFRTDPRNLTLQLAEALRPTEKFTKDKKCPLTANNFQRSFDGAFDFFWYFGYIITKWSDFFIFKSRHEIASFHQNRVDTYLKVSKLTFCNKG